MGLFRRSRVNIAAFAFDEHFLRVVAEPVEFFAEEIGRRTFVSGDRLDIYELSGEGDNIHA